MSKSGRAYPAYKLPLLASGLLLLLLLLAFAKTSEKATAFKNPWPAGRFALLQALALQKDSHKAISEQTSNTALLTLGQTLFYDDTLNPASGLACASCHQPERAFSDGLKHPVNNPQKRNTPTLFGAALHRWQFWDGRSDSLWSQAFGPLYSAHEIGLRPAQLLQSFENSSAYRYLFEAAIGPWPSPLPTADSAAGMKLQTQIALALEAFVTQLSYQPTPFDHYIYALENQNTSDANLWLDEQEIAGLEVFLRSNCVSCHRGSSFSDGNFHNIGTGDTDPGRAAGIEYWTVTQFNCESDIAQQIGRSCDANAVGEAEIPRLLKGAFKTPSLRELTHTAPYMHDGRYGTLEEVIEHYRKPPAGDHGLPNMAPISEREAQQLVAFLRTLSSDMNPDAWYAKAPSQ